MKIRLMEKDDIQAITKGEIESLGETLGENFFIKELTNPAARFWVVIEDADLIGYLGAYILEPSAEIINFYVLSNYRKKGFGSILFKELLKECMMRGITTISLEVREDNTPAISFYLKQGFKKINVRKQYYQDGTNALVMQKVIE